MEVVHFLVITSTGLKFKLLFGPSTQKLKLPLKGRHAATYVAIEQKLNHMGGVATGPRLCLTRRAVHTIERLDDRAVVTMLENKGVCVCVCRERVRKKGG